MSMRRILAVTAAVMIAGGVSLTGAPTASADALSAGCASAALTSGGLYATTGAGDGFFAGETIMVSADEPTSVSTPTGFEVYMINGPALPQTAPLSASISYTFLVDDPDAFVDWRTLGGGNATWTISCGYTGLPPAVLADVSAIPQWVQAYGRSSQDAACHDGWNPSWQSWAEPVTGGWACTRGIPSLG
jgi:hypothetical protein